MLSEGHKRRCFGAKWRRSSPRPNAERLGVYTISSFQPGIFGLVEWSTTPERVHVDEFSLEADMRWADIWCAWNTKACIENEQRPRNHVKIDSHTMNYMICTCPLVCQPCIHLNDGYPGYHSPTIHLGLPDFDGSSYTQKTPLPKAMPDASTFSSDVSSSASDDVRSRWVDLQDSKQNKELICFGQARFIQLI